MPKEFYYVVGFLLVTNVGTVFAFLKNQKKDAYEQGKRDAQVDAGIKDAKECAVRAHKRLTKAGIEDDE